MIQEEDSDGIETVECTLDDLGRVLAFNGLSDESTYFIDQIDNIWEAQVVGESDREFSISKNGLNQIKSIKYDNYLREMYYDDVGNLTYDDTTDPIKSGTYAWDSWGDLYRLETVPDRWRRICTMLWEGGSISMPPRW